MAEDDQDRARETEAEREAEIEEEMKRVGEDPDQVQAGDSDLGKQSAESGEVREESASDEGSVVDQPDRNEPAATGLELDDVGTPVVDADGNEIGVVAQASREDDAVHVDVNPGVTERILSKLGWTGEEDVDHVLPPERIRSVSDDRVVVDTGGERFDDG